VTTPNVVDSSGWLEYFIDSERASLFARAIEDTSNLIVPVVTLYEVFKKVLRERGEHDALQIASVMQAGTVVELDVPLVMSAARFQLPLADSIIYATAQHFQATLWTQDEHFEHLAGVRFFRK
jgi:predicted nucleic acid-binding protein